MSRWDHAAIAEGLADPGRASREDGPYALQARIAACHATAPSAAGDRLADDRRAGTTSWPAAQPSPVIELNRAVAHGYAYGPRAGLALLAAARAGGALDGYPPALAVEADLTARLGDRDRAAELFRQAAAAAFSDAERRALLARAIDALGLPRD